MHARRGPFKEGLSSSFPQLHAESKAVPDVPPAPPRRGDGVERASVPADRGSDSVVAVNVVFQLYPKHYW